MWSELAEQKRQLVYFKICLDFLTIGVERAKPRKCIGSHRNSCRGGRGRDVPAADLVWASFPCQDLSLAGNLTGARLGVRVDRAFLASLQAIDYSIQMVSMVTDSSGSIATPSNVLDAAAFPTDSEARLVDELRASGHLSVSLVAAEAGSVVGHVACSPVTLAGADSGLGLGPVAVVESRRRRGIGAQLIRSGLETGLPHPHSDFHSLYLSTYNRHMAQVTVYLPTDVLEAARKHAREQHRSLSAWVSELIRRESITEWPESLKDLLRRGSADLVEPDDPAPEDVEAFR